MSHLIIRLLGTPQIELDGSPIVVDTRKAIALMAYLSLSPQAHRRSTVATFLWPESDNIRGRTALRRTLATLNKAIGKQWIKATRTTLGLAEEYAAHDTIWIDIDHFRKVIEQVGETCADSLQAHCSADLMEAVDLYRGNFMEGFTLADSAPFDDWQAFQAAQLRQEVMGALAQLTAWQEKNQEWEAGIATAQRWLLLDQLSEGAQRTLMRLYTLSGRRAAGLQQYQQFEELLEEELGVPPESETTKLYEQIVSGELKAVEQIRPKPPVSTQPTPEIQRRYRVARPLTSFVGRTDELAEIERLLANPQSRLITLVGSGGIGKTRLAIESGLQTEALFEHGVCFVDLTVIDTPTSNENEVIRQHLVTTIANALDYNFSEGAGSAERQLLDFLRDKALVLILDNFEHLMAGADLLTTLLQTAQKLQLIITTQERLNLQEEWLIPIQGLTVEPENASSQQTLPAVQLFIDRATQIKPQFRIDEQIQQNVLDICYLVGGIPLGIELAATWVRVFSCQEIARRIRSSLDFLTTSLRNLPTRQRSLRAVFEHAWQLLAVDERKIFRSLAVFQGGFSEFAALEVAQADLFLLLTLLDKSLLQRSLSGRYAIPPIFRQYLLEKTAQAERLSLAEQHAHYFANWLSKQTPRLQGKEQKQALDEIRQEFDNIRIAWQWLVDHKSAEILHKAAPPLFFFYERVNWLEEGVEAFAQAANAVTQTPDNAKFIVYAGALHVRQSNYERGRVFLSAGRNAPQPIRALSLNYSGIIAEAGGNLEQAEALQTESLSLYQAIDARWDIARVLNALGNVMRMKRQLDKAQNYYQQSLSLSMQLGDQRGIALCYHNLGYVKEALGESADARAYYDQSIVIKRNLGDQRGLAYTLNNAGFLNYVLGNYSEGYGLLQESLQLFQSLGYQRGAGYAHINIGHVQRAWEDAHTAQDHYQQALTILTTQGDKRGVAFALEGIAEVTAMRGKDNIAWEQYQRALQSAMAVNSKSISFNVLLGMAQLMERHRLYPETGTLLYRLKQQRVPQQTQPKLAKLWHTVTIKMRPDELETLQTHSRPLDDWIARLSQTSLNDLVSETILTP